MDKRKKDFGLLFAAILLMVAGAVGIVFAAGETPSTMDVSSVSVTASSGGVSTTAALNFTTGTTVATTESAITDTYLDSNIVVKFNQNVADTSSNKSKISLQKLKTDGTYSSSLITESSITIYNKNITIDPSSSLNANTFYLVTIGSGISNSDIVYTVASDTTCTAIFKTGSESIPTSEPASTTFSAILTSPANSGNTVTDPVNLNSADFSFTFSEAVKNNGLYSAGIVTVTKVSGGSQTVASDGAIVASALSGDGITFPTLGSSGSTSAVFTVDPTRLEPSATYQFKIKSTATAYSSHTLGTDVVYTFTTSSDTIATSTTLEAIYLYPTNGDKDVAIDSDLQIGFTQAILLENKLTNGKAIELADYVSGVTLPAVFTLNSDKTLVTINPSREMEYGNKYTLRILDGQIKKEDSSSALSASEITFTTTSFSDVSGTAVTSGSGLNIAVQLTNSADDNQNVKIAYVVRRDKGARLEDGGTVVVKGLTSQIACAAGQTTSTTINIPDITVDQYGNQLGKTVYVDLYVQNSSGNMLYNPIHITAQ